MNLFTGHQQTWRIREAVAQLRAARTRVTAREQQILDKLTEGRSYKEIAAELNISIHTVGNHLRHIYEKLHVHSRSQAVMKHLSGSR